MVASVEIKLRRFELNCGRGSQLRDRLHWMKGYKGYKLFFSYLKHIYILESG